MADIAWLIHACMSVVFYALWFGLFPAMCNVLWRVLALDVCVLDELHVLLRTVECSSLLLRKMLH